jgi:hypothetical protein
MSVHHLTTAAGGGDAGAIGCRTEFYLFILDCRRGAAS